MEHRTKNSERLDIAIVFPKTGRTKSEFRESCDINYILKKYQNTGQLPLMQRKPIYGDFSTPVDYQTAQNIIIDANHQFDSLPSDVRQKFNNDPAQFLEFVSDPNNKEEMVKMGIAEAPSVPDVDDSNVVVEPEEGSE